MIDLCERAARLLTEAGLEGVTLKRLDGTTGREGVVVRAMPCTAVESYYDGERTLDAPYEVIVRRRSEERAMEECSLAAEALEGVTLASGNGSYEPVGSDGQQVYTAPQELALDGSGMYAWHVRMHAWISTR